MATMTRARASTAIHLVVGALALVWALVPPGASAQEPTTPGVELTGVGTWTAGPPALAWANAFFGAPSSVRVGYLSEGSQDARRSFIDGASDFLISGQAFTSEERADLAKADRTLIDLPIQAVGLAFLVSGPFPVGLQVCRPQPGEDDPEIEDCIPAGKFEGPLRLFPEDLGDIVLESGRNNWANQRFQSLVPAGLRLTVPLSGALPVVRSDGGATNRFLQEYLSTAAPDKWNARVTSSGLAGYQPSENWPFIETPARSGLQTVTQIVASWQAPSSNSTAFGGVLAPTSPLAAAQAIAGEAAKPAGATRTELWVPELQNGAGEWVQPTGDSITRAVAAGEGEPLYGLKNPVPGAWPITWVNRMYVPATGLSGKEANALASIIRWQATVGSDGAGILRDGKLTPRMVSEALAKADQVVESNCRAAGLKTAKSSQPGDYAPKGTLAGLGQVSVCVTGGPADTGADSAAAGASGGSPEDVLSAVSDGLLFSDGNFDSTSLSDGFSPLSAEFGAGGSLDTGAGAFAGDGGGAAGADGAAILASSSSSASLPMPIPGDDFRQMDRLATLALGAGLYLGGRSLLRRRMGAPG